MPWSQNAGGTGTMGMGMAAGAGAEAHGRLHVTRKRVFGPCMLWSLPLHLEIAARGQRRQLVERHKGRFPLHIHHLDVWHVVLDTLRDALDGAKDGGKVLDELGASVCKWLSGTTHRARECHGT